ncbi:MAG: universal stress protein [Cyanobacteria bacterium TGS_CYA1]|nr:universal stress protein [Cyanobacteria bacterium TGS_CYA1]
MMKVLVALDGSECSRKALEYVASMPWKTDTQFCLFTAIYLWQDDFNVLKSSYDMAKERAKKKALELLEQEAKFLQSKLPHNQIEIDYIFDRAREALVEKAFAYKADLIVMGSHGRSGFKKLLMGSVAEYVTNIAPCSVHVVKNIEPQTDKKQSA